MTHLVSTFRVIFMVYQHDISSPSSLGSYRSRFFTNDRPINSIFIAHIFILKLVHHDKVYVSNIHLSMPQAICLSCGLLILQVWFMVASFHHSFNTCGNFSKLQNALILFAFRRLWATTLLCAYKYI
jgi:hypothetical protein